MAPKPRPSPSSSSSSSGSESGSAASSDDEQQPQQRQPPQETQPSPPSKKALSNPKTPSAAAADSSSSSGEDEEEDGSDENSDSPSGKPPPPGEPSATAAAKAPPSESESESGSDSSDSEAPAPAPPPPPRRPSRGADPSIKPIASKPMDGGAAKPKRAAAAAAAASEVKLTPEKRKRPAAADAGEDPSPAAAAASGKKLFQRVWTAEDEIAVLEGMVAFQAKHGGAGDPAAAVDAFYESIPRPLRVKFSKTQLSDKMRRLRKKYETNLRRSKKKGADPAFAKSHEQASFQLSKKIWAPKRPAAPPAPSDEREEEDEEGEEEDGPAFAASAAGNGAAAPPRPEWGGPGDRARRNLREAINLLQKDPGNVLPAGSMTRALELLKPATAKAMDERWGRHFLAGAKLMLERTELTKDLLKCLVNALDSS